jgi:hypothetical protein
MCFLSTTKRSIRNLKFTRTGLEKRKVTVDTIFGIEDPGLANTGYLEEFLQQLGLGSVLIQHGRIHP